MSNTQEAIRNLNDWEDFYRTGDVGRMLHPRKGEFYANKKDNENMLEWFIRKAKEALLESATKTADKSEPESEEASKLIQRYYDGDDSEATCIEALRDIIDHLRAENKGLRNIANIADDMSDVYKKENEQLQTALQSTQNELKAKDEAHKQEIFKLNDTCAAIYRNLQEELEAADNLIKELVSANPECCWRKCWDCGKRQIHRSDVTPGVLCRFCGSQDTRLLKKETNALKGQDETINS